MTINERIQTAEAAVAFAAKRSNRVPAKAYQAAVAELLAAKAIARTTAN